MKSNTPKAGAVWSSLRILVNLRVTRGEAALVYVPPLFDRVTCRRTKRSDPLGELLHRPIPAYPITQVETIPRNHVGVRITRIGFRIRRPIGVPKKPQLDVPRIEPPQPVEIGMTSRGVHAWQETLGARFMRKNSGDDVFPQVKPIQRPDIVNIRVLDVACHPIIHQERGAIGGPGQRQRLDCGSNEPALRGAFVHQQQLVALLIPDQRKGLFGEMSCLAARMGI